MVVGKAAIRVEAADNMRANIICADASPCEAASRPAAAVKNSRDYPYHSRPLSDTEDTGAVKVQAQRLLDPICNRQPTLGTLYKKQMYRSGGTWAMPNWAHQACRTIGPRGCRGISSW